MSQITISLTDQPDPKDIEAVRRGLSAYNVEKVPDLLNLPDDDIAVFLRDEQGMIQGGVVAEVDWGVLYVDLLWVDDALRGKTYGKALMHTVEQAALEIGLPHAYMMTTEFQALPFYQHIGYTLFGTLMNRPHGYAYYYLHKMNIQPDDHSYDLPVTIAPRKHDVRSINRGLRNYCERYVDCTSQTLCVFIRCNDDRIMGGIVGNTYWDWYDLRYFWIDECLRGQGYGKQLLQLAESECQRRGMTGIVCDTNDFQSLPFYQSQGFEVFATMPHRPPGHESYFLKKLL